MLKEESN